MTNQGRPESIDLERREFQLSLFACLAIAILAGGLALLMYPAVFANRESSSTRPPKSLFTGSALYRVFLSLTSWTVRLRFIDFDAKWLWTARSHRKH
jgi:hypothetical protein